MTLRKLVALDAIAGGIAAIVLLVLRPYAPSWLGLSEGNVDAILVANASYSAFASWNATRSVLWPQGIQALAAANATWTIVCCVMLAMAWLHATWLGLAYIGLEGLFCALLAVQELRMVRAPGAA